MSSDIANTLSKRGRYTLSQNDFLSEYLLKTAENPFHPVKNPEGIINLGTVINRLMESELEEMFEKCGVFRFNSELHQHYFTFYGNASLRSALARFLHCYFDAAEPISPENIIVLGGAASCLDSLAHALFDPGDIYLTPTPTYARIYTDFNDRSLVQPVALELPEQPDSDGKSFMLTSQILEDKILQLKSEGKTVKGFVFINPGNPLGNVYSTHFIRELLEVCARYEMHVVLDEVYALSLLNRETKVSSVLSISNLPDPNRTHFVWSASKDLGLAGLRMGVVYTKNQGVLRILKNISSYCPSPGICQDIVTALLNNNKWFDEIYLPKYRMRLQKKYEWAKLELRQMGANVRQSEGGLFVWFNVSSFLSSQTEESEIELFNELYDEGIFIVPGTKLFCKTPGWFRLVFSMSDAELEGGLERIKKILQKRSKK